MVTNRKPEIINVEVPVGSLCEDRHLQVLAMRMAGQSTAEIAMRLRVTEVFVETTCYEMFQSVITRQGIALVIGSALEYDQARSNKTIDMEGILIFEATTNTGDQPRRRKED